MKLLEVIVTSLEEARAAEDGGADRLELVRNLEADGLTPELSVVERVLAAISVPVRVMVRETPSFSIGTENEKRNLMDTAHALSQLPVNGLVLGFLKGALLTCAPSSNYFPRLIKRLRFIGRSNTYPTRMLLSKP